MLNIFVPILCNSFNQIVTGIAGLLCGNEAVASAFSIGFALVIVALAVKASRKMIGRRKPVESHVTYPLMRVSRRV